MDFFKGYRFKIQMRDGAQSPLDGQEALAVTEPDSHRMVTLRTDDGTHESVYVAFLVGPLKQED